MASLLSLLTIIAKIAGPIVQYFLARQSGKDSVEKDLLEESAKGEDDAKILRNRLEADSDRLDALRRRMREGRK